VVGKLTWVPVPEALWIGTVSLFRANASFLPVYMLGQIYPAGHRGYFLLGLLLKTPVPLLLLFGFSGALLLHRILRRRVSASDWLWITPGPLYLVLASLSSLQFGARLVLPAWIFAALISGVGVRWLACRTRGRAVLAGIAVTVASSSILSYPHGLAYFNGSIGARTEAVRYLADSNIDWGQAVRDVARFATRNHVPHIHLALFGLDPPSRHFAPGTWDLVPVPWSPEPSTPTRYPVAGGWYAVSAALLPGHSFVPEYREYFAEFRAREPIATAGGSIFIYRID
ncbi:MAG TPA: hypothetical protein VES20_01645, partial [Bryobacteraceae bacterium]|nr:hypothetical protein [Bryobacteraceae bacterium]